MQPSTVPSRRRAWVLAARPKTLPAAVSPVIAGTAVAASHGSFALGPALAALAGALLLQIGSNFANDYFDHVKGVDTVERIGPTRVTASGLLSPAEVRLGMVAVFGTASLIGLYLIGVGGWPILTIGAASILAALAYTGGPKPFGYIGLGDLFVFLFFGPVAVVGTYYVQTLRNTLDAWLVSIPVGALITAILVVNNLRDIETDRRTGKISLAVRIGRRGTQIEYLLLLTAAYLTSVGLMLLSRNGWLLLPWLTLPLAVRLWRTITTVQDGPSLNAALAGTARLSLLFSLLLAMGLLL